MSTAVPIGSPDAKRAIATVRARLAAEQEAKLTPPEPGTAQWPRSTTYVAMKQRAVDAHAQRDAAPPPEPKPLTRTQRLTKFIADHYMAALDEHGEVDTTQLEAEVVTKMIATMSEDPAFITVIEAAIRPTVHEIGRRTLQKAGVQMQGSKAITLETLREKVKVRSDLIRWIEWDPEEKIHIPLQDMKRRQLQNAAVNRAVSAREQQEISRWFLEMADRMPDSDATVGQVFSDKEILRLRGLAATPSPVGHQDR